MDSPGPPLETTASPEEKSEPNKHSVVVENSNSSNSDPTTQQQDKSAECDSSAATKDNRNVAAKEVRFSKGRPPRRERTTSEHTSLTSSSSDYTLRAPDGGWGWVVVVAAFFVNMIADGVTFSFTFLFQELEKEFGQSKAVTSFAVSMFHAVPLLVGPVASALTDRFGCRNVTIFGSVLASLGFFLSSFAPSLEVIYFTCGVISGFGLSMPYVAAMVIVAKYFDEKRSFAVGIACCGSGIGTLVFAEFIEFLLKDVQLTWRATFQVLAGCFLVMCICGLFFNELELIPKSPEDKTCAGLDSSEAEVVGGSKSEIEEIKHLLQSGEDVFPPLVLSSQEINRSCEDGSSSPAACPNNIRISSSLVNFPTYLHNLSFETTSVDECSDELLKRGRGGLNPRPPDVVKRQETVAVTVVEVKTEVEPQQAGVPFGKNHLNHLKIRRQSLSYRRAMLSTARYSLRSSTSCPDIYRNAIPGRGAGKKRSEVGECGCSCDSCCTAAVLDHLPATGLASWSKFCTLPFVLFLVSNFILYAFYDIMYTFMPDYAVGDLKWPNNNLLPLIGIFNTVGEVLVGYVGDKEWLDLNAFYAACMAVCGTCAILVPFITDQVAMGAISAIFGFAIAANYSLTTPIIVELVSIKDYCNAYGLLLLVQGVANLLGPPFAGYLYDATQQWYWTFGVGGANIILSGALLVMIPSAKFLAKHCCGPSSGPGDVITKAKESRKSAPI